MVSVGARSGQQREHGVIVFALHQFAERPEQARPVPVAGIGGSRVGGESQVPLVQEIVLADAQYLPRPHCFLFADFAKMLPGERRAVVHFGQCGVTVSRLAIGDHHLVGNETPLPD